MIKAHDRAGRLCALTMAAVLSVATACGGDDTGDVVVDEPCFGACPPEECDDGRCVGPDRNNDPNNDPNNDVNNDTPNNDAPNNDTPDADLPDTDEPDAELPDADEPDADDPVDADEPDTDEPDAEEDVVDFDAPLEPRPEVLTGGVSLFESTLQVIPFFLAIRRGNAGAAFVEPTPEEEPMETIGPCDVVAFTPGAQAQPFGYHAGDISLSSDRDEATLSPEEGDDGGISYASSAAEDNDILFPPGAEVTVRAAGGRHIRPFSVTLTTPQAHEVTNPLADTTVNTLEDLDLTWTRPNSGAQVIVSITPLNNNYNLIAGQSLTCHVEGDPGSLVIPQAALARMGSPRAAVTVIKLINTDAVAGDDTFVVNATYIGGNMVSLQR